MQIFMHGNIEEITESKLLGSISMYLRGRKEKVIYEGLVLIPCLGHEFFSFIVVHIRSQCASAVTKFDDIR